MVDIMIQLRKSISEWKNCWEKIFWMRFFSLQCICYNLMNMRLSSTNADSLSWLLYLKKTLKILEFFFQHTNENKRWVGMFEKVICPIVHRGLRLCYQLWSQFFDHNNKSIVYWYGHSSPERLHRFCLISNLNWV